MMMTMGSRRIEEEEYKCQWVMGSEIISCSVAMEEALEDSSTSINLSTSQYYYYYYYYYDHH